VGGIVKIQAARPVRFLPAHDYLDLVGPAVNQSSCLAVNRCMAPGAERDEVLFRVVARVATKLFVMDFQVRHRAARLTPPAIATQHLLT